MKKYIIFLLCFIFSSLGLTAQLSAPNLLIPENDGGFESIFQWGLVVGASSYTLEISRDSDFPFGETYTWNNIADTFLITGLGLGLHIYWHVNATNDTFTSPWSEVWSFCTPDILNYLNLSYPINGANNVPINTGFSWEEYDGADSYNLRVSTNSNFTSLIIDTIVSGTSFCCANLQNNRKYYWRVYGIGYCIGWASSYKWNFTTIPAGINISLPTGWNMNSINFVPNNPAMSDIFSLIANNVNIVKNSSGQFYIPSLGINTIGNWKVNEGYQIYLNIGSTLYVYGIPVVPETNPISLPQGWNMISYLRNSAMSIETALAGISNKIVIVKNNSGGMYVPSLGINTIGNMLPGQGYQIYLSGGCVLTYPGN